MNNHRSETQFVREPDHLAEVDRLLHAYFRREMPDPWPAPPGTARKARAAAARSDWWQRSRGRLALAAGLMLFILGYAALASLFPQVPLAPAVRQGGQMGKDVPLPPDVPLPKIDPEKIDPDPRDIITDTGRPARLYERRTKDGRTTIFLKGLENAPAGK